MAAPDPPAPRKDYTKTPQEIVHEFWDRYFTKKPGKVTSIFPRALYATLLPPVLPRDGAHSARNAAESYEAAARECRDQVKRIIRECHRTNEKYTDPDFDIESDWNKNCLNGLIRAEPVAAETPVKTEETEGRRKGSPVRQSKAGAVRGAFRGHSVGDSSVAYEPGSFHRLDWIFEAPQFTVDGFSSSDIKQGENGDCWWLAAVATIAHRRELMNKVCVVRDEEVGVYGFVFYRDGEWISTVVDDTLYLSMPDFDFFGDRYDSTQKKSREYKKRYQTGSEALYFARCDNANETWLPLLEKAYAKVHGDYESISGGFPGEAVEDMTGGVSTTVASNRVLRKDKFWKELVNADGSFVFSLSAIGTGWDVESSPKTKGGLRLGHAYSVLSATEEVDEDGNKIRLVRIRNPWGEKNDSGVGEWNGPWSDGSKEWSPYWLKKLNHKFGDDGIFWMSFQDVLDTFMYIHRTRLFDEKWTVVQQWTCVNVGWVSGYLNKKFVIEIKKGGTVVIVLTQLDERYFVGLEGQYDFNLHFLLQEAGSDEHICRVRPAHEWERRSVSCELTLEPGKYEVLPKIVASRKDKGRDVEDVVRGWADKNPTKLRQVGMQYDLAHSKGGIPDEDAILSKKKDEKKKKEEEKKRREKARKEKERTRRRREREQAKVSVTVEAGPAVEIRVTDKTEEESPDKFEDAVEAKAHEEPAKPDEKEETEKVDSDVSSGPAVAIDTPESEAQGVPVDGEDEDEDEDEEEEEEEETAEVVPVVEDENALAPWNAVCVMGLRVYTMDSDVTVALAEPKSVEEASSLVVDSKAVGATM
ncbi:cysteine proteinase [Podospora conica]|nr:cysteine proteinase [Schizothecium conicum]